MKSGKASLAGLSLAAFASVLMLMGSALAVNPTEAVIYNFSPSFANPMYSLAADHSGNLFGTTSDGTSSPDGAVFELSRNSSGQWVETTLVNFNGANGSIPETALAVDSEGNVYGSTVAGGNGHCTENGAPVVGCGVVFELSPSRSGKWTYKILYNFEGTQNSPEGNLVIGPDRTIYGITGFGSGTYGYGTAFKLTPPLLRLGEWKETTLFNFNGYSQGFVPNSLTLQNGVLYGTTSEGGSTNYAGLVFELSQVNGVWTETVLYNFSNGSDGGFPVDVRVANSGDLYGNAYSGGEYGYGVIFQLTPGSNGTWTESVVYNFTGQADGAYPDSPLTIRPSGNLYGTTRGGGLTTECTSEYPNDGCGVVFEVVPSTGTETVLHTFSDTGTDGYLPFASGVIFGEGANLYGTTEYGGTGACQNGCGTVYAVKP